MSDMQSLVSTDRRAFEPLPEEDRRLLDEAFERALASWEEGVLISAAELVPDRPDLREQAERIVALAQEVAVTGPVPAAMPEVPGYTLLSELGRGAMGAVYLARQDRVGGRSVALKVLPGGAAVSSRARDRFQAEANAIARLRHPHIVTVYDVVRDGTLLAFAMEPVEGPTLQELIDHLCSLGGAPCAGEVRAFLGAGSSAFDEEPYWVFAARLGVAVARALQSVHEAGLIHRDVKPSNILMRRDGTPLLSDFGLVRDPGSGVVTREGFVGTPAYAPPEQLAGGIEAADARSDVYALGVTLYHALALRTPFGADTPSGVRELAERGVPSVASRALGTPRDLATIIGKAMSPSAGDRYGTAAEMAEDLERLLSERPILARPAGVISRGVKLLRRNRQAFWGTIGGAIGVLVLVGGLMLGLVLMPRWAQGARERAWLALLDPRDTSNFANAGFWQMTFAGPPRFNVRLARAALVEYERAARLEPWDDRTALERDVVRAVISMGEDGRSPARVSEGLARRAPGACVWLGRWTRAAADEMPPALPSGAVSSDELIAIGLMSYLSAEVHPAVEAWSRLERAGDAGAFVRGGLGLYFIYAQEPGRAYPRLEEADRAFGSVSFLRAAHAEAALGVGDVELAGLLLEQARGLPRRDDGQIARLGTLLEFARGDIEGGLARFGEWYFTAPFGHNTIAGYQVGVQLATRGDEGHAVGILGVALGTSFPKPILRVFMPMAERWWDGLSEAERLSFAERAIASRGKPERWGEACVPAAYWVARSKIAADSHLADLRGLLHPHPLGECGERLAAYLSWNAPDREKYPVPPEGAGLRRAARAALGLDAGTVRYRKAGWSLGRHASRNFQHERATGVPVPASNSSRCHGDPRYGYRSMTMMSARILRAGLVLFLGVCASSAWAGDFQGIWIQGGGGGNAQIEWSSDWGADQQSNWGLPSNTGPYTGPYSCTVLRNFGNGGQLGGIGIVSSTVSATLPPAQPTPTTVPLHLVFDYTVQNGDGTYGMYGEGGIHLFAYVTGTTLFYRMNWTATYTGNQYTGVPGGGVGIFHGGYPPLAQGLMAPGATLSGVAFGTNNSETFDISGYLGQGQSAGGNGHLVVTADVFFSDTPFPPAEPSLVSPADGSSNQPVQPTLVWTGASGATSYTVKIADNPGLTNPVHIASGLSGVSYVVPPSVLSGCTTYFWGVSAVNAAGSSASIPGSFALTTGQTQALSASLVDPTPLQVCPSGVISAAVQAAGSGTLTYQWKARTGSNGMVDLVEGVNATGNGAGGTFIAAGVHTSQVTISGLADAPEDFPFAPACNLRCVVNDACGAPVTTGTRAVTVCPTDFDCDGFVTGEDFDAFVAAFEEGNAAADFNLDGFVTGEDFDAYVAAFELGC